VISWTVGSTPDVNRCGGARTHGLDSGLRAIRVMAAHANKGVFKEKATQEPSHSQIRRPARLCTPLSFSMRHSLHTSASPERCRGGCRRTNPGITVLEMDGVYPCEVVGPKRELGRNRRGAMDPRTVSQIFGVALLLVALAGAPALEAVSAQAPPDSVLYQLHPSSRLVVKTGKAGFFGFAGHTHVIRARAVSGMLVYYPGQPISHLQLKVPTDSLEVLTPPDTAEIRKVTEAMRIETLHVDRYPEMTFSADSLTARSGKMEMQLALTMHGTTRRVPVTADLAIGSDTIRATGTFTAKQSDFGIKPFSGGPAGTVKVADRVTFCFDLVAIRATTGVRGDQAAAGTDARTVPGCVDLAKAPSDTARRPM